MIVQSLVVAMLLLDPTPAPSAAQPSVTAAPTVLKEIGRVHSSVCGSIVVHANSAISSALRNDTTLLATVRRLRYADLESSGLALERGIEDLDKFAAQLHDEALHGGSEVDRLRQIARESTDPQRKAELETFADALGGALYRQKRAASDLTGFVAYLEAHEMMKKPDAQMQGGARDDDPGSGTVLTTRVQQAPGIQRGTPNEMAAAASSDFAARLQEISVDEGLAADHADAAVSGC
jgi:hypothetical protein